MIPGEYALGKPKARPGTTPLDATNIIGTKALASRLASMYEAYGEHQLSETIGAIPGSPEYYRARAREMLELAAQAATNEAKASFIALAQNWEGFAEWAEHGHQ